MKKKFICIFLIAIASLLLFGLMQTSKAASSNQALICIDYPEPNKTQKSASLYLQGWVMSKENNASVRVWIDNQEITSQITRFERQDVINGVQGYGNIGTNPKPGWKAKIDILSIKDGNHTLKVQSFTSSGTLIGQASRTFYLKKYDTIMCLDMPEENSTKKASTRIQGWVMSENPDEAVKVYINGKDFSSQVTRYRRPDVNHAVPGYGGIATNMEAGFQGNLDLSGLKDGSYIITVQSIIPKTGEVLSQVTRKFNVHKYDATMCLDMPQNNINSKTSIYVQGWSMTEDKERTIKVTINGRDVSNQVHTYERPDVINGVKGYGGKTTNPTPGFKGTIDLTGFRDGKHQITIQILASKTGEVLDSATRSFTIKKYEATMCLDMPVNQAGEKVSMYLQGWTMTEDKNRTIHVTVDGKDVSSQVTNYERPDVISGVKGYGGVSTNPKPGFKGNIDLSGFKDGKHTVVVKILASKTGEVLDSATRTINLKKYDAMIHLDAPSLGMFNTNQTLYIQGWEMSEYAGTKVQIFVNNKQISSSDIKRVERPDVISGVKGYGGASKNATPGFTCQINLKTYGDGKHVIKIQTVNNLGEVLAIYQKTITTYQNLYSGFYFSNWQETIDWNQVKNQSVTFAIPRIGYGKEFTQKDQTFEANYAGAKKEGIKVGTYLYSYAQSVEDAKQEAYTCLKWLQGKSLELPVFYDLEDASQEWIDRQTMTNMAKAFCEIIHNAGYKTGVYANKYWLNSRIYPEQLPGYCDIWMAHYTYSADKPSDYKGHYQIWQYTSKGSIPGISGNVDLNLCYKKYW